MTRSYELSGMIPPTDAKKAKITYTMLESTNKKNPFYLQNLMYDLPFDLDNISTLTIQIIVPQKQQAYIIDDLHFVSTITNNIELVIHESSNMNYRLFIANHHFCEGCKKREFYGCQQLSTTGDTDQPPNKNIKISLKEPHAQAYLKCHYLGDQQSAFNLTTTQHHQANNTTSKVVVKGVLDGKSKLASNNTILVDKALKNISAEQNNKNLVLSSNAHVVSIPNIIVNSKKVACKHGATVSSISPEELFYLQSRGIERMEAEKLLIEAFLK